MRNIACLSLVLFAVCAASPVRGQQDREREALRRMQQQMQKLQQSNTALEKEKAELTKRAADTESVAKEAAALRSQNAALKRDAGLRAEALEKQLTETRGTVTKLQTDLAEARNVSGAQKTESEKVRAELKAAADLVSTRDGTLKERESTLEVCSRNNTALVQQANEVLDRLSDGRCKSASSFRWDPVTQLGRVKFENEIERYRALIADQRVIAERRR